jgi:hypothetical protein
VHVRRWAGVIADIAHASGSCASRRPVGSPAGPSSGLRRRCQQRVKRDRAGRRHWERCCCVHFLRQTCERIAA